MLVRPIMSANAHSLDLPPAQLLLLENSQKSLVYGKSSAFGLYTLSAFISSPCQKSKGWQEWGLQSHPVTFGRNAPA